MKNDQKKILIINKFLYPKGGDAVSTLATCELLRSKGHRVMLWGMKSPSNPELPHQDLFVDEIDFNSAQGFKTKIRAALNVLYSIEAKRKIEKLISIEKPDVVHLHNFAHQISPSILHVFERCHIPVVMTMHDYKLVCPAYTMLLRGKPCEQCRGGRYYRCVCNKCTKGSRSKSFINMLEMYLHHYILYLYDLVDLYTSPSVFLKEKIAFMGFKRPIAYLPNFVDSASYGPAYGGEGIVYVGRLSPEKGLRTLLEAVRGLDIPLSIIGDGQLADELRTMVDTSADLKNVSFRGYRTGADLQDEICNALFVVVPSEWYENNPRSVIEAFALGKPVVGSRIGGIPELVKDGVTGFTFEPGNVIDLREKIKMLAANQLLIVEMGKNARKLIESEYNEEKHYERLMVIYNRAIEMHKR